MNSFARIITRSQNFLIRPAPAVMAYGSLREGGEVILNSTIVTFRMHASPMTQERELSCSTAPSHPHLQTRNAVV